MTTTAENVSYPFWTAHSLKKMCQQLRNVIPSPFSSPTHTDVPVFRAFQEDAFSGIKLIDAIATRHAWPNHNKR